MKFVLAMVALWLLGCTEDPVPPPSAQPLIDTPVLQDGPWEVGLARGALFAPRGLSLGGYGGRIGPVSERADRLGASLGRYHNLTVRAVAVSNGGAAVVLVKLPMVFPTDLLRRNVIDWLAKNHQLDFGDALLLNATHTHSGPARYWALPEGLIGLLGLDNYDAAVMEGLAASIGRVVIQAWQDRQPARVGMAELTGFDPWNRISSDRRSANDNLYTEADDPNHYLDDAGNHKYKDHRMWLVRIEDADGKPLGAIVRMGVHGTVMAHQLFSEDVPGAIEQAVQQAWDVPFAMYLQGAAGDASPRGGDRGKEATQQLEAVGQRVADVARETWQGIETTAGGVLAIAHQRDNLSREKLGYRDDEFGRIQKDRFVPFEYGAFYCGELGASVPGDGGKPETKLIDGELGCITPGEIEGILEAPPELPLRELSGSVQTAIQWGDWTLVTFPGEPVARMQTLTHQLLQAHGFAKPVVLGYSQAHLFYLTNSEDWYQGGYEAAMNMWGWRLGDFLIDQTAVLAQRLKNYGSEPVWSGDSLIPLLRESEEPVSRANDNRTAPHWIRPDATYVVAPGEQARFAFIGGDSWVDDARIEIRDTNGKVAADSHGFGFRIVQEWAGDGELYDVLYEPGYDIAPGKYRLYVQGHYVVSGTRTPYELEGPVLEIQARAPLQATAVVDGASVRLFPAWVSNPVAYVSVVPGTLERYQMTGLRLVHESAGPAEAWPVTGTTLQWSFSWEDTQGSGSQFEGAVDWNTDCTCYLKGFARTVSHVTALQASLPAP